jgi:N-acetylglucosamine-6-sulfatase
MAGVLPRGSPLRGPSGRFRTMRGRLCGAASVTMRTALVVTLLVGAAGSGGAAATIDCSTATRSDSRPNVIVVLADDQTVEQVRVMPTVLDRLARVGTVFTNSVVNYSNCCPSRATLLTGQHASHHGVLWNSGPTGGYTAFEHEAVALPVALAAAGYETVLIGKYFNRYGERDPQDRNVPPGWSDFKGLVFPAEAVYESPAFIDNGRLVERRGEYTTTVITDYALDALDRLAPGDDPFFMLVAHIAPHGVGGIPLHEATPGFVDLQLLQRFPAFLNPPQPEPRYAGRFADEPLPQGAAFNEPDQGDKPPTLRRQRMDGAVINEMTENYRAELESLLSVDDSVAAILDRLEQHCALANTVVIYTSDNGFFHGEHRFPGGKYFPYEPSIRVPLIVAGPGVPIGAQPSLVSNVDLAPTIADLAEATLLLPSDGRSILPLLDDPDAAWGRAVYLEGHAPSGIRRPPFDGVHTGDSVYVEYRDGSTELYNVAADPAQLENLADELDASEMQAELEVLLEQLRACAGDSCRNIGSALPVPAAPSPPWLDDVNG